MTEKTRDLDAELNTIVADLERRGVLVVTPMPVDSGMKAVAEIQTHWVASNSSNMEIRDADTGTYPA